MTKPDTLRIGIIGAGGIVRLRHLPGLRNIPGVEIAVVCNRRPETAEAFAKEFGIPEVARNWQDVVQRSDLDIIWIGTTPQLHAPITIAALQARKHVFCQARMAGHLNEARAMLAAAQSHPELVTMLCPPPNALKHGRYFEELLRQRTIGDLYHFQLRSLTSSWLNPSAPAHWRQKREISGNNVLSVGIYAEIFGRFLGYPLELCAQGRVCIPQRSEYTVEIPDFVHVIGRWPGNLEGTLQWSGVAQADVGDLLEIFGSHGTLAYDFTGDRILLAARGEDQLKPLTVPSEFIGGWTVESDFIRAVREGGHPEPSFATGVRYMEVVEAVKRSMDAHAWVSIADL